MRDAAKRASQGAHTDRLAAEIPTRCTSCPYGSNADMYLGEGADTAAGCLR